jgi:hypothetical protein
VNEADDFGRWHVAGERRVGGRSSVYRVAGPRGELGALKLANTDAPAVAALLAEREQLAAIVARDAAAPRWLAVPIDRGQTGDGRPWLVLPWYRYSLRSWLHETSPGLAARLELLRLAVDAVCRLHETGPTRGQPRLHLDLKPDNFLVEVDGAGARLVLADLGGARVGSLVTAAEPQAEFTARYAPLEVVLGVRRPADPSVDAFALAVVIYEALTGAEPRSVCGPWPLTAAGAELAEGRAEGERRAELAGKALGELVALDEMEALAPRDLSRLRNAVVDLLDGEVLRAEAVLGPLVGALQGAMAPDPGRRSGDLRKLAAGLEVALAGCGVGAAGAVPSAGAPAPVAPAPVAPAPAAPAPAPALPSPVAPAPTAAPPSPATETDEFVGALREDPIAPWLVAAAGIAVVALAAWAWLSRGAPG